MGEVSLLDGAAAEAFERLASAMGAEDWDGAVAAQMEWLLWRAASILEKSNVDVSALGTASNLPGRIIGLLASLTPALARDDLGPREVRKIEAAQGALETMLAQLAATRRVEKGKATISMLILSGGEIARAEVLLSLAEAELWDRFTDLQEQVVKRRGGKPVGFQPRWQIEFAKHLVAQYPSGQLSKRAELIRAVYDWNAVEVQQGRNHGTPGTDNGIGLGIDRLAKLGIVRLMR